jgi:parallel beta-helix repeat protein
MLLLVLACATPALAQTTITQAKAADGIGGCDAPGFPVTICAPGSYVLKSNLRVPNQNTTAIHVVANDVTIDLNGFAIFASSRCLAPVGEPCPSDGRGVDATDRWNVAVLNGTVRGMGEFGVIVGPRGRVERVRALTNGFVGIMAPGFGSTVVGNTVANNADDGIRAGFGSTVTGNTAEDNGGDGIRCGNACTVAGNTAHQNGKNGIIALESTVVGNTALRNGHFGLNLSVSGPSGYAHNVVRYNSLGAVSGGTSLGQNLCNLAVC